MFCPECGTSVQDGAKFCPECGFNLSVADFPESAPEPEPASQPKAEPTPEPEPIPTPKPKPAPAPAVASATPPDPTQGQEYRPIDNYSAFDDSINDTSRQGLIARAQRDGHGMKWYKFCVYFSLLFSCLYLVIQGFRYATGVVYEAEGVSASYVYAIFPALRPLNIVYGLGIIAVGVLNVIVWRKMFNFKKGMHELLYGSLIASLAVSFLYSVVSGLILSNTSVLLTAILSLIFGGLGLFLQRTYFEKRRYLFVND